jgi:protein-tyrosine sulfotransferase
LDLIQLLGYRRRWLLLRLFSRRAISPTSPIVIGGCERSGTTLLRVLLGRHPMIAAGQGLESTVFQKRISSPAEIGARFGIDPASLAAWQRESRSQVEFIDKFQDAVLAREQKPIWLEKMPMNVLRFGFIRRHFPNARLIHVVRDGRDVVCSMRRQSWIKGRWESNRLGELRHCASDWLRRVASGCCCRGDPRYYEVRYEDLVRDPEGTLRGLLAFLGLGWSDALLVPEDPRGEDVYELRARSPIDASSVGVWRRELQGEEKRFLCGLIGDRLIELGYERDFGWAGGPAHAACRPSRKRWTRVERILIEAGAVLRTIRDPRLGWRPRAMGALFAIACLVNPVPTMPDPMRFLAYFDNALVFPLALGLTALLAPSLLREKRSAVKRWRATHSAARGGPRRALLFSGWPWALGWLLFAVHCGRVLPVAAELFAGHAARPIAESGRLITPIAPRMHCRRLAAAALL